MNHSLPGSSGHGILQALATIEKRSLSCLGYPFPGPLVSESRLFVGFFFPLPCAPTVVFLATGSIHSLSVALRNPILPALPCLWASFLGVRQVGLPLSMLGETD